MFLEKISETHLNLVSIKLTFFFTGSLVTRWIENFTAALVNMQAGIDIYLQGLTLLT